MKWKDRRRSTNVDDRRGERVRRSSGGKSSAAGGMLLSLFVRSSPKTKLLVLVAGVVMMFVFGISPMSVLNFVSGGSGESTVSRQASAPNDQMGAFLATIKADNEDVWARLFRERGQSYRPAKMVIYSDRTVMPGGLADARMGPFYMPSNETVYIDPHFFREMSKRFGASGDFAQAYVIAHEIGHHVQNLLGYSRKVDSQRGRVSKKEYNRLSVRLELQADFFAGVFANHADRQFDFLESGDIQEAMNCAKAIGDDTLQKNSGGRVMPDSFTHGTSEQRSRWFMKGYKTGDMKAGNTFEIPYDQL